MSSFKRSQRKYVKKAYRVRNWRKYEAGLRNRASLTVGMVFGLASRQTEGFLRSLLGLLNLDNDVPDHTTISRREAKLRKVPFYQVGSRAAVHILIDSSGLAVYNGQLRSPPRDRDYRKLHLCVDESTGDVIACDLTSRSARDSTRVVSVVGPNRSCAPRHRGSATARKLHEGIRIGAQSPKRRCCA